MILETARLPWAALRAAVSTNDVALAAFDYVDWPSSGGFNFNNAKNGLKDANGVYIAFHGTNGDTETSTYKLYGRNRTNGPIQLLLEGVVTLGPQVCTLDPVDKLTVIASGLWADSITVTGGIFNDSNIVKILDHGKDRIAMLKFDKAHIEEMYVEFQLTQTASMYAVVTGY